jgi:hypothetical protein
MVIFHRFLYVYQRVCPCSSGPSGLGKTTGIIGFQAKGGLILGPLGLVCLGQSYWGWCSIVTRQRASSLYIYIYKIYVYDYICMYVYI